MSKVIQLRNVPDALHRRLKARAAKARMSLSDYLLMEITEIAKRPMFAFAEFRGIGNPGIGAGRKTIQGWLRRTRGQ